MTKSSDSVFRLSLVGLAFILIFFLLILSSQKHPELSGESAGLPAGGAVEQETGNAPTDAEAAALRRRVQALDSEVARLTADKKAREEHNKKSQDPSKAYTETLFSALDLRNQLEQRIINLSANPKPEKLADGEIAAQALDALSFKQRVVARVEKELDLGSDFHLEPGQEAAWEQWFVNDSQLLSPSGQHPAGQASGEHVTLRAQVELLRERLKSHNDSFLPPCWFDATGQFQYLLAIDLQKTNGGNINVNVRRVAPPARESSARDIPGVRQFAAQTAQNGTVMSYSTFIERARAIAQYGGQQCHYSLLVTDKLRDGPKSEKIYQELETYFHVVNTPR